MLVCNLLPLTSRLRKILPTFATTALRDLAGAHALVETLYNKAGDAACYIVTLDEVRCNYHNGNCHNCNCYNCNASSCCSTYYWKQELLKCRTADSVVHVCV
jgi:hypothetical protein